MPYVILISLDGYRYDYTEKYNAENLKRIASHIQAKALIPSYPSKTFPNHYTLVTGLYPENHGLVGNEFYDPERKGEYRVRDKATVRDGSWYGGTPLWVLAEQQGVKAASYFWVGSEANIQGVFPSYYKHYDGSVSNSRRINQVIDWLKLPEEERPHFITLYFSDVDTAGHLYGPDSKETGNAVRKIDKVIGRLKEKLEELDIPVNLMVVSDHGMSPVDYRYVDFPEDYINFKEFENVSKSSTIFMVYDQDKAKILEAYKDLEDMKKYFKVLLKEDVPESLHFKNNDRIGDLLIMAESPYSLAVRGGKIGRGTHGYNPYINKEMSGIFYAEGPLFKEHQTIKAFENVNVYPLIAYIFGLKYNKQAIDGNLEILKPILR
ncbi:alkaline phosphatase family protein [Cytophagales bacterium RKSG123]|nr:alkaline phosphatase family protein [Xanthovirga aplysinae]